MGLAFCSSINRRLTTTSDSTNFQEREISVPRQFRNDFCCLWPLTVLGAKFLKRVLLLANVSVIHVVNFTLTSLLDQ